MKFNSHSLEKTTALSCGILTLALGALPQGFAETAISGAALIGISIENNVKFGIQWSKILTAAQQKTLSGYEQFLASENDEVTFKGDLAAADAALAKGLASVSLNPQDFINSAQSTGGLSITLTAKIMDQLGSYDPDLFGNSASSKISYRFARDMIQTALDTAMQNAEFFKQLQSGFILSIAEGIAELQTGQIRHGEILEAIKEEYQREIKELSTELDARQSDLTQLLAYILGRPVPNNDIKQALKDSFEKLTDLQSDKNFMASLHNEEPEIAALLAKADEALNFGDTFSLERAEHYLQQAREMNKHIRHRSLDNEITLIARQIAVAELGYDYCAIANYRSEAADYISQRYSKKSREFLIAIGSLGDTNRILGQFGAAQNCFDQAILTARHLMVPEDPNSIRDISVSLNKLGDIQVKQGELNKAEAMFNEGLELRRKLMVQLNTPESIRDVSVSLERLGDIQVKQGELDKAETMFNESLELARELMEQLNTPESVRDVSVSLEKLGDIQGEQGELDKAEAMFNESLELDRKLMEQLNTPESIRDMSVSLNKLGDIQIKQGELDKTEAMFNESLELARKLMEQLNTPESIRDVIVSLAKLAQICLARDEKQKVLEYIDKMDVLTEKLPAFMREPLEHANAAFREMLTQFG